MSVLGKHPCSFLLLPSETTELFLLLFLPTSPHPPSWRSSGIQSQLPLENQPLLPLRKMWVRHAQTWCLNLLVPRPAPPRVLCFSSQSRPSLMHAKGLKDYQRVQWRGGVRQKLGREKLPHLAGGAALQRGVFKNHENRIAATRRSRRRKSTSATCKHACLDSVYLGSCVFRTDCLR